MKKSSGKSNPFKMVSPVESIASPTPEFVSLVAEQSIESHPAKNEYQDPVIFIQEEAELNKHLIEVDNKLVLIAFLLLGVQDSDTMLKNLISLTKTYSSIVLLVVDVAVLGDIAKKYNVSQIPWFTFMKNNKVLQAYHSIRAERIETTVREQLFPSSSVSGSEHTNKLRSYIKDDDDLERRLAETENKLVVLAFMISDDESGQRLNMDLDEIEAREDNLEIIKVDVDLCQEVATKYHIQGVPTLVFLKDRKIVDQFMGNDTERIHNAITEHKIPNNDNKTKEQ